MIDSFASTATTNPLLSGFVNSSGLLALVGGTLLAAALGLQWGGSPSL
ncbi:MAG: hypothetical protein IPH38_20905 [Candidatus Microthrix sp.]|nr:hypothetical protein [Candidatus Microthrix sp.]MBK7021961.1 hypothetical protein [Candidatus Microthrix sp.]